MASLSPKLRRSVAQERSIAKKLAGGRRVAASGALTGLKGDVKADRYLVEAKQTVTDRYALTMHVWRKIETEAFRASKTPVLIVEMSGRSFAVLDMNDFLALQDG